MEVAERVGWSRNAAQNRRLILGFVGVCTMVAAVCGWSLAGTGSYAQAGLLTWHRWLGLGFGTACLITLAMCVAGWKRCYEVSLSATFVLMLLVGHLGGSITHGPDFLTRYIPSFTAPGRAMATQARPTIDQPFFPGVVQPILQEHCVSCHNAQKHKADLRLDTFEELLKGGLDGPVIKAGHAEVSPLIQCMVSTPDADGHMPPEGQQQPTAEKIALIEWWVNAGASANVTVSDLKPNAGIKRELAK